MPKSADAPTAPWHLDEAIRIARVDGVDWPYIDTGGAGPALMMLPGSVGTCEMFFKQIASLGARLRLICVSYPAEPDAARLADGLAGLMSMLDLERASVVGSSFGGYWAQVFAQRHPDRLNTVFIGNAFIRPDELFANPLFDPDFIRNTTAQDLQATWQAKVAEAPDSELKRIQVDMLTGRQGADNLKARFLGVIASRPCPPLAVPPSRIVIIDCNDDPLIQPVARQAVRDHFAGATVHTLPTGGHYPHILNQVAYDNVIAQHLL